MLTRKILFEAFIINLSLQTIFFLMSLTFFGDYEHESLYITCVHLFKILLAFILFIAIFKESSNQHSMSFTLAIVTYFLIGTGFEWPGGSQDFTFMKMLSIILFPVLILILSYIFFRKKSLDLAKAFSFLAICYFFGSSIKNLFLVIFPQT
jgi:hypothetical protein